MGIWSEVNPSKGKRIACVPSVCRGQILRKHWRIKEYLHLKIYIWFNLILIEKLSTKMLAKFLVFLAIIFPYYH